MGRAVVCLVTALLVWGPAIGWAQDSGSPEEPEGAAEEAPQRDSPLEALDASSEPSVWWVDVFGFVRTALEFVQDDPNVDFVGENNGFVLYQARLGVAGGHRPVGFSFNLSFDGAADIRDNINVPEGELAVRLRDAYIREDPADYVGFQLGQFIAPFSAEELRGSRMLRFVSRSVGLEGVRVGRGYEQEGIVIDRQLGLMINSREPITFGPVGLAYYAMIANGNGKNELLNDNSQFAYYGRLELFIADVIMIGGSILTNKRTEGELPDQFDERDFGWTVDLELAWERLEVIAQYTTVVTEFETLGTPNQRQVGAHAQAFYVIDIEPLPPFGPAYRYAYYDNDAIEFSKVQYHTFGLNILTRGFPVTTILNYTLTVEEDQRELQNNRFEALVQIVW